MKVVTVVGARPQFVKAAVLSRVLRARHQEILVHTGQHYDPSMSEVFFQELGIGRPEVTLDVGSGTHGAQTGAMLAGIERVVMHERPDWVLVHGDTNSTLAGALAAVKLHVPVAHVEAGVRSFNRRMPEEINRVVTDQVSTLRFCPSRIAAEHLAAEGITEGVHVVGDVMAEALADALERGRDRPAILDRLGVSEGGYLLVTIHRAENTDDPLRLATILGALDEVREAVIFPVHPRTRRALDRLGYQPPSHIRMIDPVGPLDMARFVSGARLVLTDSGGLQKEAYWLGVPCLTARDETEWVETIDAGWNRLVGADRDLIAEAIRHWAPPAVRPPLYADGRASERCVSLLEAWPGPGASKTGHLLDTAARA